MSLFRIMDWVNRNRRTMRAFDYACGAAMIGYGVYAASWLWGICGVAVVVISWYDPATRLQKWLPQVMAKHQTKR